MSALGRPGAPFRRAWIEAAAAVVIGAAAFAGALAAPAFRASAQDVLPPGGYRPVDAASRERERLLDESRVHVARLRYGGGGDWYADPSSIPNLLREFSARTGIPTARSEFVVEPADPRLFRHPFLYVTGHGNVKLNAEERDRLREHLLGGGFLWADDCYGMDESFRRTMREMFPERELVLLPLDHPVYRSFYAIAGPPKIHEHDGASPQGWGITDGGRLMVFYTYECDIGDGLEDADVHDDPPEKREAAIQMAVNILYYALTSGEGAARHEGSEARAGR